MVSVIVTGEIMWPNPIGMCKCCTMSFKCWHLLRYFEHCGLISLIKLSFGKEQKLLLCELWPILGLSIPTCSAMVCDSKQVLSL